MAKKQKKKPRANTVKSEQHDPIIREKNPTRLAAGVLLGIYALCAFIVALALSWWLLYTQNFFYGVWHDHGGIREGIDTYGPQNRYRAGYHLTDREQRVEMFAHINHAVHNHGQGLAEIRYVVRGKPSLLLHNDEVVHLQDVANLIDSLRIGLVFIVGIWLGLSFFYWKRFRALPSLASLSIGVVGALLLSTAVILLIGAEKVFNTLHIWIFPAENKWFFYYQDSLMSTLMLAPTLFAYIAVEMVVLAILCFLGLQWGAGRTLATIKR